VGEAIFPQTICVHISGWDPQQRWMQLKCIGQVGRLSTSPFQASTESSRLLRGRGSRQLTPHRRWEICTCRQRAEPFGYPVHLPIGAASVSIRSIETGVLHWVGLRNTLEPDPDNTGVGSFRSQVDFSFESQLECSCFRKVGTREAYAFVCCKFCLRHLRAQSSKNPQEQ
jgi:hypothetical protein